MKTEERPAVTVNPDVLPPCLLSRSRRQVLGEGGWAEIVELTVQRRHTRVAALHRLWLPAPDVVQLEVDARLHLHQ